MRTRQLVADLSRELERVRTEANRLLAERDEEIVTLESERELRQKEMSGLYKSLDTLLGLGHGLTAGAPLGAPSGPPQSQTSQAGGSRPPSVLDRPDLQAAAQASRNAKAAALEQEVRQLEEEIARMAGRSSPTPPTAPPEPAVLAPHQPLDDATIRLTIRELNAQVARFRQDVADLTAERAALRRLYSDAQERLSSSDEGSAATSRQAGARIAALEADRSRLAQLLDEAEKGRAAARLDFDELHRHVEAVSQRVAVKMQDLRTKLERAKEEAEGLRAALEGTERELAETRRREWQVEEELKWARSAGGGGRVASGADGLRASSRASSRGHDGRLTKSAL